MFGGMKRPLDKLPYPQSPDSRPLTIGEVVGRYVYVVDLQDTIHVVPDGSHEHPKVLGLAQSALYAGDLRIDRPGQVAEVTNLSGTFQFSSQHSLCCVAKHLHQIGFTVGKVKWFPPDGSSGPVPLQCS